MRSILVTFIAIAFLFAPNRLQAQTQSTGQRIGTVVSDIVKTAFPAVNDVIKLIWPNVGSSPNDTKKAADAKAVLDPKKTTADAGTRKSFDDLKRVATNLSVVRQFLANCAAVDSRISIMKTQLAGKTEITDPLKSQLQTTWTPAASRLTELKTVSISDVDETFLKQTLLGVQDAIKDYKDNVSNQLEHKDLAGLNVSLLELQPKVSGIVSLTTILIDDLAASLKKAVSDSGGSAGPLPGDLNQARDRREAHDRLVALYKAPR